MTGSLFCGIHLAWNYTLGHVDCHMPGYINKALTRYQHPKPVSLPNMLPTRQSRSSMVHRFRGWKSTPHNEIKCIQDIISTLLYYVQAVDPTFLATLSAIAARQSNGTRAGADACHQVLDYIATYPNAGIRYKACNMVLSVHTDVSYLSKSGGKSRAASCF